MPQGDKSEKERKITAREKRDEAYYRKKGWFSALPEWLWIRYADGTDNKAEASKHWKK
jgi:hypothetical protein